MSHEAFNLLCPFQRRWLAEPAGLALGVKSRRIGWTWTQALGAVLDRVEGKGNYYHSSADLTAAEEFVEYCADWARMVNQVAKVTREDVVVDEEKFTTLVIRFGNGTKIVAGSSRPKFFRSKGGAVGLDEFAHHEQGREMYKAAHATAMFWGYPLRIWSTHNGASYFAGLVRQVQNGAVRGAVHTVSIVDAVADGICERIRMRKQKLDHVPEADEGYRRAWLEELRSTVPDEETWQEEYMGVPASDNRAFLPYELIRQCEVENLRPAGTLAELAAWAESRRDARLYCGYDVGRSRDLSVLWVLERVGDVLWTRGLMTLAGAPYQVQLDLLSGLMRLPAVRRLCIDKGLIGNMLAELLANRFGRRVEGVQFSQAVMSDIALPLRTAFEDRSIRVPAAAEVREDLHKPRKIVVANHVRFETPRDEHGHADRFWSLALAYAAADVRTVPLPAPLAAKPVGW